MLVRVAQIMKISIRMAMVKKRKAKVFMNSGLDNPEIVSVEDEEYGAAALKAGIIVAANANQNPPMVPNTTHGNVLPKMNSRILVMSSRSPPRKTMGPMKASPFPPDPLQAIRQHERGVVVITNPPNASGVGFPNCLANLGCLRVIGARYSLSNCSADRVTDLYSGLSSS